MEKEFPVIEVSPSGKSRWMGGAWCLVWVYSTEGNFLLKGFMEECEKYIKDSGWKCWAIFNLYHTSKSPSYGSSIRSYRTIIKTYKCDFNISEPNISVRSRRRRGKKKADDFKFKIYSIGNWRNSISIKRLPGKFVNFNPDKPELVKGSLGENDALKSLKDKMDQND